MLPQVNTRDPRAVQAAVEAAYREAFPTGDPTALADAFEWAQECFEGRHPGYQVIDARYHDFEHTLQGTLCLARLLAGWRAAGGQPALTEEAFRLAILAVLLHDTGYLKRTDDREGSGAKYTLTHVARSAEFAAALLADRAFTPSQILTVQNLIRCTGLNANLAAIPFQSELEQRLGRALATADLLGQMAAPDYVEKLPLLYEEFVEAGRFSGLPGALGGFTSAEDLIARTPAFWRNYVKPKIENDFAGLYHFLDARDGSGRNAYLDTIEANLARIHPPNRAAA
jgi:hypothetical protein